MVSWAIKMEIVCKTYTPRKLTYQLTIAAFTKLLAFHLLDSCIGYTISKYMAYDLLTILLLSESFPTIS